MGKEFTNYRKFIQEVMTCGELVYPRGQMTIELTGTYFMFEATKMFYRPGMNTALGWAELMMLLCGFYDPSVIQYAAPKADMSLYNPKLMYGPRVYYQYSGLIKTLKEDPDTREAILVIGSGDDGATWDQPCTTSIQFLLRHGRLNAHVNMRSQDLIKGLPYDVQMFSGLTQSVALELGVFPGTVVIKHGSAHIYAADLERLLPVTERVRRFCVKTPILSARRDFYSEVRGNSWKPIPTHIEVGEWESVVE